MKNFYTHNCGFGLILLLIFFSTTTAKAQNTYKLSGQVTDTTGQAIPGVHIQRINTTNGATTDFDGHYNIQVTGTDRLSFTYLGYQPQIIAVNGRKTIDVQLSPSAEALDEVVINAGYYRVKDRERTGSIEKVTSEDIELQPLVSPLQTLQGRMAGVEISTEQFNPGAAPSIKIRGQNSLRNEGNYPLYIIDGLPISSTPVDSHSSISFAGIDPLSTLNISNIESIEVLKDADATAIYGSRGANGVILITTKKGESQKGIQARIYSGAAIVPNKLDLLDTKEYLQLRQQAFANDQVDLDEYNAYDLLLWDQNRNTDWQDYFLGGTADITDVNISAQGGNDKTNFRLNGSFHEQGTIYLTNLKYQKFTGGLNLNHRSEDEKLRLNLSVNYGIDNNKLMGDGVDFNNNAFSLAPNAPKLFSEDNNLNWEDWGDAGLNNPLEGVHNTSTVKANNLMSSFNFSYKILKGLEFKTNFGFTHYQSDELVKMPKRSYNPAYQPEHSSLTTQSERQSWIIEPQLHYKKQWKKLNINAFIGSTFQENKYKSLYLEGHDYTAESLIGNLGAAESIINAKAKNTDYRYQAVFARAGFNWSHKYFLNLTGRRDGSSRFAKGKRFANFGAIGAAWIFTEEGFFDKNLSWLSFGKIRGSYGTTGNDQIPDYGYLDAYEATRGPGGLYPVDLANPKYSWEKNKKTEIGIKLGFLEDQIDFGLSFYRNRSSNQLVGYPLPSSTGFKSVQANLPATVENSGWEATFTSHNFSRENFSWQTSFNISFPKNELISYPGLEQSPYAHTYREGHPLNIALLYEYDGIDPDTGYYRVKDQNGDAVYDEEDKTLIQDRTREYFGGINNTLTYKGLSLQFLFQFVKQEGSFGSLFNSGFPNNLISEVNKDGTPYSQVSQTSEASRAFGRVVQSNFVTENASFIRLKTLNLSYQLPSQWLETLKLSQAKFFVTGHNLWTITDYKGMDPDSPIGGLSFGGLKSFTGGIQLNF